MQSRPCPNCGRPVPAQATTCQQCGARFQPGSQRASARPSSAIPPGGPTHSSAAPTRPPRPSAARSGPPRPLPSRSSLPTQPPGRSTLPKRPVAAPPGEQDRPAAPAPRKSRVRLILLLAALVGIIIGGTIGFFLFTGKPASPTTRATPTSAPASYLGKVSFAASGGLQGSFTVNLPKATPPASSIQQGASATLLEIVVNDAAMEFELGISPYPGPGTYALLPFQTNPAPGSHNGAVRISNHHSTWSLHSGAQCQVSITDDTPLSLKAQNRALREVKGTFACPTLANDAGGDAAINITQGQFDVYAEVFGS